MSLGLGALKLAPRDFWAMTAFELLTALGLSQHNAERITRAKLEQMIKNHPDH